jgi:hypothetical protein
MNFKTFDGPVGIEKVNGISGKNSQANRRLWLLSDSRQSEACAAIYRHIINKKPPYTVVHGYFLKIFEVFSF